MAITTLTGALAGMQPLQFFSKLAPGAAVIANKPYSYWGVAGAPGAGTWNTTLNGGTYSSSGGLVNGQLPHLDPASGNSYLSRLQVAMGGSSGFVLLLDRLWDNGGITITSTTAQTIASPTWPARDSNGATAGLGVLLGVEVSAAVGAATPTITIGYTNSAGTASRTATNADGTISAAIASSFYRMNLQAGDVGVQSVQSLTLSASWISGTINVVAFRVLAALEINAANLSSAIDVFTGGMPQIWNGSVPYFVAFHATTTGSALIGQYGETQG